METPKQFSPETILPIVVECLREVLLQKKLPIPDPIEETRLIGSKSVLDSLGLVTLVVDIEQRVEQEYGCYVPLTDERAMSQTHSPFRSPLTLADYLSRLLIESVTL